MKIYIDSDYKCHVSPGEGLREFNTSFFDGKCNTFIEGYRYVPYGETWTRADDEAFNGEMIAPWRNYDILTEFQKQYEELEAVHMEELGALIEEIYFNDMEAINDV